MHSGSGDGRAKSSLDGDLRRRLPPTDLGRIGRRCLFTPRLISLLGVSYIQTAKHFSIAAGFSLRSTLAGQAFGERGLTAACSCRSPKTDFETLDVPSICKTRDVSNARCTRLEARPVSSFQTIALGVERMLLLPLHSLRLMFFSMRARLLFPARHRPAERAVTPRILRCSHSECQFQLQALLPQETL